MVAVVLVLGACGSSPAEEAVAGAEDALPATPVPADQDPGLVHVHGLGVNPGDGLVYAATHFGLWRLPDDGPAERVGDYGYDLMGFTVVGADHFLASGHPSMVDDLPPLLGLIETTDGGKTWHSVSLLGDVDFHTVRNAHNRVYGWSSSDSAFMVSENGGQWERRSTSSIHDFVVDPDDPEVVLATAFESLEDVHLIRSGDGGRSWEEVGGPPVTQLAWEAPKRLFGVGIDGSVWRSSNGGQHWEELGGLVGGRPEAVLDAGDALYVAAGGEIVRSDDGGETWELLHRSE